MTISFGEAVDRPVLTRQAEPNPFGDFMKRLADDRKLTLPFTAPLPTGSESRKDKDGKNVTVSEADRQTAAIDKIKRQLSAAAAVHNVSPRSTVERTGSKTAPTATFKVWAVDKIVKADKATDAGSDQ